MLDIYGINSGILSIDSKYSYFKDFNLSNIRFVLIFIIVSTFESAKC